MNIMITGGAGYIGSVIADYALKNGYRIKVVDLLWFNQDIPARYQRHPHYSFIKGDIRDAKILDHALEGVDFIIHTAAIVGDPAARKFPELTKKINYEGSIHLIEQAIKKKIRGFIFFSTCSNYGIIKGLATEQTPLRPLSLYSRTKVEIEQILCQKSSALDWIICRLSTAYGVSPRMRFDLTVNDFTLNAYKKKFLDIFLPHTYRPYIHVKDIARVVLAMISRFAIMKNNVFNVGFESGNYKKIDIAMLVQKFVPETTVEIVKTDIDKRDYQVDFSKLRNFLEIENEYNVEKGIQEIITLLSKKTIDNPFDECYYNTFPKIES